MALTRPRRRDLPRQPLGDDLLVYTPDGGVCSLNGTALQVWDLCDGQRPAAEIAREFSALHPAGEAGPGETRRTLELLARFGLLEEAA